MATHMPKYPTAHILTVDEATALVWADYCNGRTQDERAAEDTSFVTTGKGGTILTVDAWPRDPLFMDAAFGLRNQCWGILVSRTLCCPPAPLVLVIDYALPCLSSTTDTLGAVCLLHADRVNEARDHYVTSDNIVHFLRLPVTVRVHTLCGHHDASRYRTIREESVLVSRKWADAYARTGTPFIS